MANRQIGWSTESNLLWQIGNQIDRMTGVIGSTLSTFVPQSRTLTINGVTYDLSANRSWTVATGLSGTIATGQVAFGSATNTISGTNNLFWDAANSGLVVGNNVLSSFFRLGVNGNIVVSGTSPYITFNTATNSGSTPAYIQFTNATSKFDIVSTGAIEFFSNANARMRLFGTGNLGINTGSTDSGQRLQVNGDAFIKGSGATSATNALLVQNTNGTLIFSNDNSGTTTVQGITNNDSSVLFRVRQQNTNTRFSVNALGQTFIGGDANAATDTLLRIERNFNPTSGTATHITTLIIPTINQTGGANGITRGLYINPTLIAAADWRSIEWSNNSGWGLYGAGTANNYLGGALAIGTSTLTGYNLRISKNITGATTGVGVAVDGIILSDVTSVVASYLSRPSTNDSSFNLGTLIHFSVGQGTFRSPSSVSDQYGFLVNNELIGATNNYAFFGNIPSGTNRWNLYMNGTADNYLRGKLLINTTTVGTFLLDVNGTARVSGSLIGAGALSAGSGSIAFLTAATTSGNVHSAAIGYNAISSNAHAFAFGYNSSASANPSFAFGYDAQASGSQSTAFSNGRAVGIYSIAGGYRGSAVASHSVAFGYQSRAYLNGQFAISGGNMDYNGDSQYSVYTGSLNTGAVGSGGTYSFTGVRPSNGTFGSGVSQIWFVEAKIVFAVKGKNTSVTEFNLDDTYTCVYRLAVKSNFGTGTSIIGTPTLSIAFNDTNMATTSVSFTIVSNNLVANVTPPTWASAGQVIFRGTLSYELTELGNYAQIF